MAQVKNVLFSIPLSQNVKSEQLCSFKRVSKTAFNTEVWSDHNKYVGCFHFIL